MNRIFTTFFLYSTCLPTLTSALSPTLTLINSGKVPAVNQPATLGYVFAPGEIKAGQSVTALTAAGATVPMQVDAKATHADGSLRHAVLTLSASLAAGASEKITLASGTPGVVGLPIRASDLLATAYDATVLLNLGGVTYTASARTALQAAVNAGSPTAWLSGPMVSEWLVPAACVGPGGPHPHLAVRFAIRAYAGLQSVRTDITVENDWAYEPNPRGFTYDVSIQSGGQTLYSKSALAHSHHARWRKIFWWGGQPTLDALLDVNYLRSTGAVPNYDPSIHVSASALAGMAATFEPMSSGNLTVYMPETGAHDDIGPLPRFSALYLLSGDAGALQNVLANGMAGGSYPVHYRDKTKGLPVSLDDYPYMTLLGNSGDTRNPATGKLEEFPAVTNGLDTLIPDDAHQPSIAYLPYLITGDYFFLEELQFWANWNVILANPYYRDFEKGLLKWSQVRGQAWSLRTLGHAAYITPDTHPMKAYFVGKVKNNLDWYTRHIDSAMVNKLGWLDAGGAVAYSPNGIAPWQDDFFTWATGHLVALGFSDAKHLAEWKSKFVVGRLTDPGYCWLDAPAYNLQIGPADKSSYYATFTNLYQANFPGAACAGTVMTGYPEVATGFGANMQPALAAAVDAGIPKANAAWVQYQARNPKQDYTASPQFAVVPYSISGSALQFQSENGKANRIRKISLSFTPGDGGIRIQYGTGSQARFYGPRGELWPKPFQRQVP